MCFQEAKFVKSMIPMRIMLDHCLMTHACIAVGAEETGTIVQQGEEANYWRLGLIRSAPHVDSTYQREIDALFTLGRLIREGSIQAYTYDELIMEAWRDTAKTAWFNAFKDCKIEDCPPALWRSRFRTTNDFAASIRKGGKNDRRTGVETDSSQIAFFEFLCDLTPIDAEILAKHFEEDRKSLFEATSLRDLSTFKVLCKAGGSSENYPDMFHLWTAERNSLEALVTIDKKLVNIFASLKRAHPQMLKTQVLTPSSVLQSLGIKKFDDVPMEYGKFYPFIAVNNG